MRTTSPLGGARLSVVTALTCAALFAVTACSGDGDDSSDDGGDRSTTSAVGDGSNHATLLELLTEDDVCALVPEQSVAKAFGVEVENSEGISRGRVPPLLTFECKYETVGLPTVKTSLDSVDPDEDDDEVLDDIFTDLLSDDAAVGEYEKVPGLGRRAAFGPDPTLAGGGINARTLGVIGEIGTERVVLTVSVTGGTVTVAQARPVAEEMLTNLESFADASH